MFVRRLVPGFALLLAACGQSAPDVRVTDAWARATAPGQRAGAIYLTIDNRGGPDRLTGVATEQAGMAMIHASGNEGGVSRMRMVNAVDLPADGRFELRPGGTHVMLDGLAAPLIEGNRFPLTLRFARSGVRQVEVAVVAPGSR